MSVPRLRTARLMLRPVQETDLESLWIHWRRPEVRRYLCDDREIERDFAAALLARSIDSGEGLGMWCVEAAGRFAVVVWLQYVSDGLERVSDDVEFLYSLEPEIWGRGFATEAAHAVLRYAFDALRLPRVLAGTDPPNAASVAVIRRLGMQPLTPSPIARAAYFAIERGSYAGRSS